MPLDMTDDELQEFLDSTEDTAVLEVYPKFLKPFISYGFRVKLWEEKSTIVYFEVYDPIKKKWKERNVRFNKIARIEVLEPKKIIETIEKLKKAVNFLRGYQPDLRSKLEID